MVEKAQDPIRKDLIDAEEFLTRHGANYQSQGIEPLCPVCDDVVYIASQSSLNQVTHYRHYEDQDCPTKWLDKFSEMLMPSAWDRLGGEKLLSEFCFESNLKEAYQICRQILPRLDGDEFYKLCCAAHRRRIWRFAGLPLWAVPYLMTTLRDVTLPKKEKGEIHSHYTVRVILSKKKRSPIDEVWAKGGRASLRIYFVNDDNLGKELNRSPIPIPYTQYENRRSETKWMSTGLIRKIQRCCENRYH